MSAFALQNDLMRFAQVFILGLEATFSFLVDRQQSNVARCALSDGALRRVRNLVEAIQNAGSFAQRP